MPLNPCSGSHDSHPDLKDLKKALSGNWINPDTGETEKVKYTNHRFCNHCKLAFPRKGHVYSNVARCPCCHTKIRGRPHGSIKTWHPETHAMVYVNVEPQTKEEKELQTLIALPSTMS